MIKLKNLSKLNVPGTTDNIPTLQNINIEVKDGEFIALQGPSGSGKSELLKIIGLLDISFQGSYKFDDTEISSIDSTTIKELRKKNIGYVFQNFGLIDELTIYENIELPLLYLNISSSVRKKQVLDSLEKVNLGHRKNYFPSKIPVVQQQKVSIARAMIVKPKLLLADEPTINLKNEEAEEILKLISQINEEGTTIILATSSSPAACYAHRLIHLFEGKVVTDNSGKMLI